MAPKKGTKGTAKSTKKTVKKTAPPPPPPESESEMEIAEEEEEEVSDGEQAAPQPTNGKFAYCKYYPTFQLNYFFLSSFICQQVKRQSEPNRNEQVSRCPLAESNVCCEKVNIILARMHPFSTENL